MGGCRAVLHKKKIAVFGQNRADLGGHPPTPDMSEIMAAKCGPLPRWSGWVEAGGGGDPGERHLLGFCAEQCDVRQDLGNPTPTKAPPRTHCGAVHWAVHAGDTEAAQDYSCRPWPGDQRCECVGGRVSTCPTLFTPCPPSARLFLAPPPPPCVTFRRVVAPLRGPGQSPVRPFACCVGSLRSVGRCGRCSRWCRFRVRGAQWFGVPGLCWLCLEDRNVSQRTHCSGSGYTRDAHFEGVASTAPNSQ